MKQTTIRAELYTTRLNKQGFAPIRLIYQFGGVRKIIQTEIRIRPISWDVNTQRAEYIKKGEIEEKTKAKNLAPNIDFPLPYEKEIKALNDDIQNKITEIRNIEKRFELDGKKYTLEDVLIVYKEKIDKQGVKADAKTFIIDFIDAYIKKKEGLIKPRTLQAYANMNNHLKNYAKSKKDKPSFETFDHEKINGFHAFLIRKGLNNTTVSKIISTLKTLMKCAVKENKLIKVCPDFRDYTVTRKDSDNEVIALTQDEFYQLMDLDLTDENKKDYYTVQSKGNTVRINVSYKTLDRARDIFIFSCVTGLRYSDLATLRHEHIRNGVIKKKAIKTGQMLEIPLNIISEFIINKYSGGLIPLPVMSNQRANDYIKTLGRMAGINETIERSREYGTEVRSTIHKKYELMSMHMGRRTFATLSLEMGAAAQDVMSLTGHKRQASFKRYINITSKQRQKAMSVWNKELTEKLKTV